jgi:HSP20 family protein
VNLIRWDPFRELVGMRQAMDRLLEGGFVRPARSLIDWTEWAQPSLDMYQTPKEVVVKAALPGVDPGDVEIEISGNTLTIKGETRQEERKDEEDYLCRECHYGSYYRSITLPQALKSDKAKADFEDGVLTLTIPKAEVEKPKKIEVKAKKAIEGKEKKVKTTKARKSSKKSAKKKEPTKSE